jgi:TonB-linked SusC/RagA family outer membrane protein
MKWRIRVCLFVSLIMATAGMAQAQTGRVTGQVLDSSTAQPLVGARVIVVGTTLGGNTDADGHFTINNVPAGAQQIRALRIGFTPGSREISVTAGQTNSLRFELRAQAVQLSPVVSIGYGTQLRRDVTGSVSTVTTEGIDKAPIATIDQMLQGTSPGVQVTTASSEPGGAISVRIRGTSSITGNSEPLYVIDGFPIENDIEGEAVGNGGRDRTTPPNPLVTLNPSDIESISILKDASATAIYGARGANGVVIITTKQGRGTKPVFSLDSYSGVSSVAKTYDLLNSAQYMDYANEYGQNSSTPFTPFPDTTKARILASGIDTNWQDLIFRQANVNNIQLGVRGATATANPTRYALSLNKFNQEGIVLGSGIRRMSGRLNLVQSFGDRFEFAGNVTASQARSKSTPTAGQQNANAGAVSAALQYVPILPVRRPDGSYSLINPDLNNYNNLLDAPQTPNPISLAEDVLDSLSDTRVFGNLYGQAELFKDLRLKVSLGVDYADRWRYTYFPRTEMRGAATNGQALRANSNTAGWLNENTLTYDKTIGSSVFNLLGGFSRQASDLDGDNMSNSQFVSDITGYYDIGAGTQIGGPTVSSRHTRQTLESWLSRLNYSLMDKYLFTFTYRADGSSRFAENKKWGSFPSAAFAWRAGSEPFFKRFSAISDLKFRFSYGLVGNPSIRPYQSLATLDNQGYSFGGTPFTGYYTSIVGNPDLTWETTRQFDQGVDLSLWNRVNFTGDLYQKRTNDLLLNVSLPFETGFESALANRGSIENKGVELGLDGDVIGATGDRGFRWHTSISFAKNRNKVLSLGNGVTSIPGDLLTTDYNLPGTLAQVGQPLGVFYGFKSLGIIRDSAAAAAVTYRNFSNSKFKAGQTLIANLDGDSVITLSDRTIIGDPTPDFTYGWTNTISVAGFELTGLLQGQHGGKILNVNRIRTESSPRANISVDRWLNRWTPQNPDAKYPVIGENPDQVGPNNFTSNLLESASYLRLRTLTLSKILPESFISKAGASSARIYVTGTNLFTKSNYSGFDPDVSSESVGNLNRGIDIGAYPLSRTFTAGVSLQF